MNIFAKGDRVKVAKISESPNPEIETASRKEYVLGQANAKSLFLEYWLEGTLDAVPMIGTPILVNRTKRNGVTISGYFHSSIIQKIYGNRFETANSIYLINKL